MEFWHFIVLAVVWVAGIYFNDKVRNWRDWFH